MMLPPVAQQRFPRQQQQRGGDGPDEALFVDLRRAVFLLGALEVGDAFVEHALEAGVAGGGLIASGDSGASSIGAKVKGTRVLGELCKEFAPDFLLLCSSLAAYGGVAGSADYTAANAFLDAYAESASASPCRGGLCISFCYSLIFRHSM